MDMGLRITRFLFRTLTFAILIIVTTYLITFVYLGGHFTNVQGKDLPDAKTPLRYDSALMSGGNHCRDLHFANPPLPATALVGPPGSGKTWLRHLLQEATGIFTGSVYYDSGLKREFPAEGVMNGSVIVIKCHVPKLLARIENCSRIILLVRNPFRTAFAIYHRRLTRGNHTGIVPAGISESKKIGITYPEKWYSYIDDWLKIWTRPILVVTYENLKRDTMREMKIILDFLGLKVSDEHLYCMLQNSKGKFQRRQIPFTPETFQNFKEIIQGFKFYINKPNEELQPRFGAKIDDTIPFRFNE